MENSRLAGVRPVLVSTKKHETRFSILQELKRYDFKTPHVPFSYSNLRYNPNRPTELNSSAVLRHSTGKVDVTVQPSAS